MLQAIIGVSLVLIMLMVLLIVLTKLGVYILSDNKKTNTDISKKDKHETKIKKDIPYDNHDDKIYI